MNIKFDKICLTTIDKAQKFLAKEDYEGLSIYLDMQRKYVEDCRKKSNKELEYVDTLVSQLK